MALERVHRITNDRTEEYPPVRLGPQDLRDVSAAFQALAAKVPARLTGSRTKFILPEHETTDLEDVLGYADADTLPSIHVIDMEVLLGFHAGRDGTMITRLHTARNAAEKAAVDEAVDKLRSIIEARQVKPFVALRQRGAGKWLMFALLSVPALLLIVAPIVLDLWLTETASQAVAAAIVWLSILPTLVIAGGRPKDLIRLRGQQQPWTERRQGLIALVGLVLSIVIPLAILALGDAS